MNVYVVSNCWWRDGATVIGAATDPAGAEAIADRLRENDPEITAWTSWTSHDGMGRRDAMTADGVHPSLYQEIVCVPLAGWPTVPPGWDAPERLLSRSIREMINRIDAETVQRVMPVTAAVVDAVRMIQDAKARSRAIGDYPTEIRVGTGSGRDYFQRVVDSMPVKPGGAVTNGSMLPIGGLPVIIDPTVPSDQIQIGRVVYVIGTAAGFVAEGTIVRIDTSGLDGPFTTPLG